MTDLEDRLENWGRVMRWRRRSEQTPSMEGNYRSPQRNHWEPPGAPEEAPSAADVADALEVQSGVALLPLVYHLLLEAWYVRRAREQVLLRVAKKAGFRRPDMAVVDAALAMGRALFADALRTPHVERKERARRWVQRILAECGA